MSNLMDIQNQIEKLQKQAADIKSREFNATVQDILAKMQAFGITVKDLQSAKTSKAGKGKRGRPAVAPKTKTKTVKKSGKAGKAVAAKYRGPNGETWSGRGLTPRWLATLVAQGQPREAFAIHA